MQRIKNILGRFLMIFVVIMVLFVLCLFLFKDSILAKAQKSIAKQLNTEIEISELDINPFGNLPYIGVSAYQLNILDNKKSAFLKAANFDISLNPLDVFGEEIQINNFSISDGFIKLERSTAGKWNYQFGNNKPSEGSTHLKLPSIDFNNIVVHLIDRKDRWSSKMIVNHFKGGLQIIDDLLMLQGNGVFLIDTIMYEGEKYDYPKELDIIIDVENSPEHSSIKELSLEDGNNKVIINGNFLDELNLITKIDIGDKMDFRELVDSTYLGLLPKMFNAEFDINGKDGVFSNAFKITGEAVNISGLFKEKKARVDGTWTADVLNAYVKPYKVAGGQLKFSNLVYDLNPNTEINNNISGSIGFKNILLKNDNTEAIIDLKELFLSERNGKIEGLEIKTGDTEMNFSGIVTRADIPKLEGVLFSESTSYEDLFPWIKSDSVSTTNNIQWELAVQAEIKELQYENWNGRIVKSNINMSDDLINYSGFMETCDGTIGFVGEGGLNEKSWNSTLEFDGIDVNQLLKQFDNFGQEIVTDKNLFGKIMGSAVLKLVTNSEGIDPKSSNVKIALQASDGKLVDLALLQDFSTYVNAEELANVSFESMTNYFEWKNNRLQIPILYIQNNASNFLISGFHDFDNRFAYNLQVNAGEVLAKKLGKKNKAKKEGWWNTYYFVHGFPNDFKVESNKDLVKKNLESSFLDKENIFFELIKTFGYNDILFQLEEWEDIPEYFDEGE